MITKVALTHVCTLVILLQNEHSSLDYLEDSSTEETHTEYHRYVYITVSVHRRRKRHVVLRFDLCSLFIPLLGAWLLSGSRNLITDEVELCAPTRTRERALLGIGDQEEVALIHRNFTGCQAGLTGLCHRRQRVKESHPVEERYPSV